MDESGDLGFRKNAKNSRHFIIAFLLVEDKKSYEKIIKKAYKQIHRKDVQSGVIHATSEKDKTVEKILKDLRKEVHCKIMVGYLDKRKIRAGKNFNTHLLYIELVRKLLDRVRTHFKRDHFPMVFFASQRETNKTLNNQFVTSVSNESIKTIIRRPNQEKCLQLVDVITWALFQKYERGNDKFFNIIKTLIAEEVELFEKQ
jgi:hypothetical protein